MNVMLLMSWKNASVVCYVIDVYILNLNTLKCVCAPHTLPSNLLVLVLSYGDWGLSWHFVKINLAAFESKLLKYFMRQSFLPRNALAELGTIERRTMVS